MHALLRHLDRAIGAFPLNSDIRMSKAMFLAQFRDERIMKERAQAIAEALRTDPWNPLLRKLQ
jgi:hypothetical protein